MWCLWYLVGVFAAVSIGWLLAPQPVESEIAIRLLMLVHWWVVERSENFAIVAVNYAVVVAKPIVGLANPMEQIHSNWAGWAGLTGLCWLAWTGLG